MAEMNIQSEHRLAVYKIGRNFGETAVNDISLEQTAIHELLHIMLHEYQEAVKVGNPEYIMGAEHSIVTVLEKLLAPQVNV